MTRQSLSELLRGAEGPPSVMGIVDVVLRDENGEIVHHEHKHNLITDQFRTYWVTNNNQEIGAFYVFINENIEAMHAKRSAMRTILPGTWAQNITPSKDGPNRIWTYATVFAPPPVTRTFKTVGLTRAIENGGYTNIDGGPNSIVAATVLSSAITQTTAQTLEVNYRLAFQRT